MRGTVRRGADLRPRRALSRRRINQENWESQRRDAAAPQIAGRAPEEHDSDPMHWWRMPVPGGRVREIDAQGEGHFGARRLRPTGPSGHGGLDIEAAPGALVVSPVSGRIVEPSGRRNDGSGRQAIVVQTDDGHEFHLLYVSRDACLKPETQGKRHLGRRSTTARSIQTRKA
jgi:murein DD-endopeptidase MepM/ murein hydrolase activator NlpD